MKKFISLMTSLLIVMSIVSTAAFALTDDVATTDQIGKHTLDIIDIEDLPDGVVPVEFNSKEEAEAYLDELEREADHINKQSALAAKNAQKDTKSNIITPRATTYNASEYKDHACCGGVHYVRVRCNYTYTIHPTAGTRMPQTCTGVSSSNLGYTLDSTWTQTSYNASINSRYVGVNVYGTMKHYLLVQGLLEMTSRELHYYDEY